MASLTVRNIEDEVKAGLRLRAARKGVSMESEVREILREASGVRPAQPALTPEEREAKLQRILSFGHKPDEPFDLKEVSDELWSFVEE